MAPIRRYLRFSERGVIEVRVYPDRPELVQSWLLHPRNPALPRIIDAVRPLLFDKLREEREQSKKTKSKRSKPVGDAVSGDDFEASVYLQAQTSPHSILMKTRNVAQKKQRIRSNSNKLTNWVTAGTVEEPVLVEEAEQAVVIREESDDDDAAAASRLEDYPEVQATNAGAQVTEIPSDASEDEGFSPKIPQDGTNPEAETRNADDKKKLGLQVSYEGFRVFGKILCLVVRKRGSTERSGRDMLKKWMLTQADGQEPLAGHD